MCSEIFHGHFLLYLLASFPVYVSQVTLFCNPVEEGSTAVLHLSLNSSYKQWHVMVLKNKMEACSCLIRSMLCVTYSSLVHVTLTAGMEKTYNLNVSFDNSVRTSQFKSTGVWDIHLSSASSTEQKICQFPYFVKAKDVECRSLSTEDILISCSSQRIYPEAKCMFYIHSENSSVVLHSSYITSTPIDSDGQYFTATCRLFQQLEVNSITNYNVTVTMYPNIFGHDTDLTYGRNTTMMLVFEYPSIVLNSCHSEVEEGSEVKCQCALKGFGSSTANYSWYNSSDGKLLTNSSQLNVVAEIYSTGFFCLAFSSRLKHPLSENLNITVNEKYQVSIKINGFQKSLTVVEYRSSLQVECTANRISDLKISRIKSGMTHLLNASRGLKIFWFKTNVSRHEDGIYECLASNRLKTAQSIVTVLVERE